MSRDAASLTRISKSARAALLMAALSTSACTPGAQGSFSFAPTNSLGLTPAQNCAIGYDLSKQIYDNVVLSDVVIVPARAPSACETHALEYLRRAGFAIDESADVAPLQIDLSRSEDSAILAVATVGGTMRLTRPYQGASEGVYPKGAVSFQQLPKGAALKPRKPAAQAQPQSDR